MNTMAKNVCLQLVCSWAVQKIGNLSYFYFRFYLYFNLLYLFYLFYKLFIFCLPKGVAKDVNQVNEQMELVYLKL